MLRLYPKSATVQPCFIRPIVTVIRLITAAVCTHASARRHVLSQHAAATKVPTAFREARDDHDVERPSHERLS
jgi:hypothetical protein